VPILVNEVDRGDPLLLAEVYPLLVTLRPQLTSPMFTEMVSEGFAQGLRVLVARDAHGACTGTAVYRVSMTSRGRVLFIDDLVTVPEARSHGIGAALLAELEHRARRADCARIELDSGVTNHAAHRFYHRHRLSILALHFAKELAST
jgi:GNAT superfamily N-acetyltransferase